MGTIISYFLPNARTFVAEEALANLFEQLDRDREELHRRQEHLERMVIAMYNVISNANHGVMQKIYGLSSAIVNMQAEVQRERNQRKRPGKWIMVPVFCGYSRQESALEWMSMCDRILQEVGSDAAWCSMKNALIGRAAEWDRQIGSRIVNMADWRAAFLQEFHYGLQRSIRKYPAEACGGKRPKTAVVEVSKDAMPETPEKRRRKERLHDGNRNVSFDYRKNRHRARK